MKIAEFSVKNYQFTLIILVLMIALAWTRCSTHAAGEDPEMVHVRFPLL